MLHHRVVCWNDYAAVWLLLCTAWCSWKAYASVFQPGTPEVPRVTVRGFAKTDRSCLEWHEQPQFYVVVAAIPLFHSILATMNRIENFISIALTYCSLCYETLCHRVPWAMQHCRGSATAKRVKNTGLHCKEHDIILH